jgi:hypothetical protein
MAGGTDVVRAHRGSHSHRPEADGEIAYATRLLGNLNAGMLLLADAGYDSWEFLRDVTATGAQYLCSSGPDEHH